MRGRIEFLVRREVGHQVSSGDILAVVEAVDGGAVASDATEL